MDTVIQERCTRVLERVRTSVGESSWNLWFQRVRFTELKRGTLQLSVPNVSTREWIATSYGSMLERLVAAEFGASMKVSLELSAVQAAVSQLTAESVRRPRTLRLARDLSNFVPTAGAAAALKALRHFIDGHEPVLNPLLICGPTSSGKSHLCDAAMDSLSQRDGALCLRGQTAAKDFFVAQRQRAALVEYRKRFLRASCVLIDDVHLLSGKHATQRELAQQLKDLVARGGRVLTFSRLQPSQLDVLDPVFASVLSSGMTVGLGVPTRAEMCAILRARFAFGPARIPGEVIDLVAARTDEPLRELEALIIKVNGFAGLSGGPVTAEFLDKHLASLRGPVDPTERKVICVMAVVADHFRVTTAEFCSLRKTRTLTAPRRAAAFLLREMAQLTLKQIGERLGGRSHTAVHTFVVAEQKRYATCAVLQRLVREVDRRLLQRRG